MIRASALRYTGLSLASWASLCGVARASIDGTPREPARIYGGQEAKTCEFPTTAGGTQKCTATLVHPRVVISAAHCRPLNKVFFGEFRSKPAFVRETKWCELTQVRTSDAQICVLKEPVLDLPLAPIIQGCESDKIKVGAKVLLSGFGLDENDPADADDSYKEEKRWVQTEIVKVTKDSLHIGKNGKGGCNGDSGGPAFLQMDDGTWRTLGATHAGANGESHPRCNTGVWKRADTLVPWYESQLQKHGETDIDLTPCFDDTGKWKPSKACGGYSKDLKGPFGSWKNNCGEGMPTVKYSATCGEPFAESDEDNGGDKKDEDATAPKVEIIEPKSDATFPSDSEIKVRAKVRSDKDLDEVSVWVDGKEVDVSTKAPYHWTLEDLGDGTHTLAVQALDEAGKRGRQEISISLGDTNDRDKNKDAEQPDGDSPKKDKKGKGATPKNGGKSKESSDASGDAKPTPDPKGGCKAASPAPALGTMLWSMLGLAYLRRRR